ncbi:MULTISPECIES: hypothetical protein [Streptomyces]|uniref:Uncharacterized protein n=1 Tax=Streptomyces siderophoricus TaxID=2802281 RepID=A0ABS1MW33_9ACTN|nr:hypothetical protein [Streptomyces sp. 9-7]MBL1091992.1 hypothetical protein [Streptomyces sp. 9-7]
MSKSEAQAPITVEWGKEQVVVSDVARELPGASHVDDRMKLVKAGQDSALASLPEDAWHALARASVAPELVALQLRQPGGSDGSLLLEEHVDGATLRSVHTRVWLTELFPGIQPRTGQEVLDVDDPQVTGMDADGRPQAILRYEYRDLGHLRQHIWQTIHATLHINSYEESILARRVTRALIVHPVVIAFTDGTEPVHALVARDGITRLASAWKVMAGSGATKEAAADAATEALLAERKQPANEPLKSRTQRWALGREQRRELLRKEFGKESGGEVPSLRAIQIAQTYVVPAHIVVGTQAHEGGMLPAADVFDDALRSILASVHVEFKPWDAAAQNLEVATRALKLVVQTRAREWGNEEQLGEVYALAVGRRPAADTPAIFRDPAIPGTPLWRAVYLLHVLTRAELYAELRGRAKEIKNERRMTAKGYAGLLGPVVDEPWRAEKKAAVKQARKAWSNGGVLCKAVLSGGWIPVPTDDFTSLVAPALRGDVNARCTLALAGGTALIADKLITSNVGSALGTRREPGKVPFRADAHLVVGGLAAEGNELGLWTLALAAQRFEAGRLPRNAGSRQEFGLPEEEAGDGAYQHVAVDLAAPDRIRRHGGDEVPLLPWDVVYASDEARARKTIADSMPSAPWPAGPAGARPGERADEEAPVTDPVTDPAAGPAAGQEAGASDDRPVGARIADQRRALGLALSGAEHALAKLRELGQGRTYPPLFTDADEWHELREAAIRVHHQIDNHRPPSDEEEPAEDGTGSDD